MTCPVTLSLWDHEDNEERLERQAEEDYRDALENEYSALSGYRDSLHPWEREEIEMVDDIMRQVMEELDGLS